MLADNMLELIGQTPIVKINKLNESEANVFAKLEYFNPAGSVKDRPAFNMIKKAEQEGLITKDTVIIEPTSGNMGIGLAFACAIKGYKLILTMPETMSLERRMLLKAYGAELVLTDGGMQGSVDKAEELHKKIPHSFIPQQFNNPHNPEIHYYTTAEEILSDIAKVDIFIAGVGTGGTLCGTAKRLKEVNPKTKIIAVEPDSSQVLAGKSAGVHKIQGIGANFIPDNFDQSLVDEIFPVTNEDALSTARLLAQKEGILVGISSGAAMSAALAIAKLPQNKNKNIVVILPDTGERYLSSPLFENLK